MLARQIAIGFGIAVIFPMLVYYGVATFHPPPDRQTFFPITTPLPPNATPEQRKEYADQQRNRQEAYNSAAKDFARILIMIATPLGVAAILIGAYATIHAIGTGLIFGGILTVGWGYFGYWQYLENWMRFVSLLAGFAVLLFIGYRWVAARRADPDVP